MAVAEHAPRHSYRQHRPEQTALYQVVAANLEAFLGEAALRYSRGLPRYVEREFRKYLECGIHAFGFLRARCKACKKELLVAFSCKRRGVCPSCNARRMCAGAAHLTDRVLPSVPVRQWVLSVPFELRLLLAKTPRALLAVGRLFVREVFRWQRERARCIGVQAARSGAIAFVQRFGGSLNLNVHYHVVIPDGVFGSDGAERVRFVELGAPSASDLEDIALSVEARVARWLERRGLIEQRDPGASDTVEPSALDACLRGSLGIGELVALKPAAGTSAPLPPPKARKPRSGRARGFDIHAGVVVSATDREGRERLLRYCARPPFSQERVQLLPSGLVAYALRKPWGKQTHRVLTPVDFLARLAALIPPPRHPLVVFHGVFAPHSAWRKAIVPVVETGSSRAGIQAGEASQAVMSGTHCSSEPRLPNAKPSQCGALARVDTRSTPRTRDERPGRSSPVISARINWAELLKRTYDVDALACSCGGRLSFIATILDPNVARLILKKLDLPAEPPPVARARSPDTFDDAEFPPSDCEFFDSSSIGDV